MHAIMARPLWMRGNSLPRDPFGVLYDSRNFDARRVPSKAPDFQPKTRGADFLSFAPAGSMRARQTAQARLHQAGERAADRGLLRGFRELRLGWSSLPFYMF